MPWKSYILTVLCLGTVTACATAPAPALTQRALLKQQHYEASANISQGACDYAGQLILTNDSAMAEASAMPLHR